MIAHEVGHHVQNLLGITEKVAQQRGRTSESRSNALSVLVELQADCFAGVWGHSAKQRNLLDPGDVEAGLAAAAAIGDDRLQQQTRGRVSPESFTHGSSAQPVNAGAREHSRGYMGLREVDARLPPSNRKKNWLRSAAKRMARTMEREWEEYAKK